MLVELIKISPKIVLDIRYATKNNFVGEIVYPSARCFLLKQVAERLDRVQQKLMKKKLGLKVFDGYRPFSVSKRFWELFPDPKYVADPAEGSRHNRGSSVDVTLVDAKGRELPMPSGFDEMNHKAHRDYMDGTKEETKNRQILEEAMYGEGFIGYEFEWWHYDDPDWEKYPLLDLPFESL